MSNINSVRLAKPLELDSVVNGEGLRMVLWFQGCLFECPGCHNPDTWTIDGGTTYLIDDLLETIKKNVHLDGITLSGGDPLFQIEALKILLPKIKALDLNVWLYSGDTYENLIKDSNFNQISAHLDVLVDGPFVKSLQDFSLDYRGSKNQRLIDIQASKKADKVITYQLKK